MPGEVEHSVEYAGSAGIATAGSGRRDVAQTIRLSWTYAGVPECLQHFSPARNPSFADFAASALGAFFGGLVAVLLVVSLWKGTYLDVV